MYVHHAHAHMTMRVGMTFLGLARGFGISWESNPSATMTVFCTEAGDLRSTQISDANISRLPPHQNPPQFGVHFQSMYSSDFMTRERLYKYVFLFTFPSVLQN